MPWLLQEFWLVHATQVSPLAPQRLSLVATRATQVLPMQHPVQPVPGPHTHMPPMQCWPSPQGAEAPQRHSPLMQRSALCALHWVHAAPPAPQAVTSVEDETTQVLPLAQHPGHCD